MSVEDYCIYKWTRVKLERCGVSIANMAAEYNIKPTHVILFF